MTVSLHHQQGMTWRVSSSPRLSGTGHDGPIMPGPVIIGCYSLAPNEIGNAADAGGVVHFPSRQILADTLDPFPRYVAGNHHGQFTYGNPVVQNLSPMVDSFIRKHSDEGVQDFGKPTQGRGND